MRSGEDRSEKKPRTSQPKKVDGGKGENGRDRVVGDALRTVYQSAVEETVPDEMLDLLSKLD